MSKEVIENDIEWGFLCPLGCGCRLSREDDEHICTEGNYLREQKILLTNSVEKLESILLETIRLITLAKCPECDGSGNYPEHSPYCSILEGCVDCPVQIQCQWCFEKTAALVSAYEALEEKK